MLIVKLIGQNKVRQDLTGGITVKISGSTVATAGASNVNDTTIVVGNTTYTRG